MISNIILPLVLCLYMPTFSDLGLTLVTPSNNQQSAQQVGTFNVNQAGSNQLPYTTNVASGGLTPLNSKGVLSTNTATNTNTSNSLNGWGNPSSFAPQPSRVDQLKTIKDNGGLNPVQQTEYDRLLAELNANGAQDQQLINEAYGASSNYLNQAESALRADYPTILNEISGQYDLGTQQATSGKSATLGTINEQQIMADQRNQNVMADARRMYDELRRGYGQRFGGASSAGGAASEIAAVEQQRQQGKIQQDYGNTLRQIETARTQVETKFQEQLANLKQVKDQAVNEANRDFQNKLLQISQSRAENEQAKASARLSALQDLRNKVYQINLQNMQFQQTLQSQKQQADSSLANYSNTLGGYGQSAQTATSGFTPSVSSNLQTSSNTTNSTNPYIGAVSAPAKASWTDDPIYNDLLR